MKLLDIEGLQTLWNKIKEKLAESNPPTMGALPKYSGDVAVSNVSASSPALLDFSSVVFNTNTNRFIYKLRVIGSSTVAGRIRYYSQWDGMEAYGTPGTGGVAPDASIVYLKGGSPVRWNGAAFVAAEAGLLKYTDKQKLDALPTAAATAEADGWMAKEDKAKLDGLGGAWQISPKQLAASPDEAMESGWYYVNNNSYYPSSFTGASVVFIRVVAAADRTGADTVLQVADVLDGSTYRRFRRIYSSGAWGSWQQT